MSRLLFLKADTSGLINPKASPADTCQPWAVAIAAELTDEQGRSLQHMHLRIRADGRRISAGAEAIHGISNASAGREGVAESAAIGALVGMASQVGPGGRIVGHGIDFDRQVVEGVLMRKGAKQALAGWQRPGLEWLCLRQSATAFCRLPSDGDPDAYREPRLSEAAEIILGAPMRDERSAWSCMQAAKAIYFELAAKGAIEGLDGKRWTPPAEGKVHELGVEWLGQAAARVVAGVAERRSQG